MNKGNGEQVCSGGVQGSGDCAEGISEDRRGGGAEGRGNVNIQHGTSMQGWEGYLKNVIRFNE